MRLKIETNETTKEKIGSALKGSFDARKDHMTREALRAGTSVGDEDRDFATGMNVARTYGMPLVSVSAAALAGFEPIWKQSHMTGFYTGKQGLILPMGRVPVRKVFHHL